MNEAISCLCSVLAALPGARSTGVGMEAVLAVVMTGSFLSGALPGGRAAMGRKVGLPLVMCMVVRVCSQPCEMYFTYLGVSGVRKGTQVEVSSS